jgi:hypothetical protein
MPAKPSSAWLTNRLTQLANLRRTKTPESLEAFASALSGFGQDAINRACERIETADVEKGEPAFPRLGKLLEECRREASTHHPRGDVRYWHLDDYRNCHDFDAFVQSEIEDHHKTLAQVLTQYPIMARRWLAWKKQKDAGTLVCPNWCETCKGQRMIETTMETLDGKTETAAEPCPTCRKR